MFSWSDPSSPCLHSSPFQQILFHVVLLATLVVTCWDGRSSKLVRRLAEDEDVPKEKVFIHT